MKIRSTEYKLHKSSENFGCGSDRSIVNIFVSICVLRFPSSFQNTVYLFSAATNFHILITAWVGFSNWKQQRDIILEPQETAGVTIHTQMISLEYISSELYLIPLAELQCIYCA